MCTYIYIKKILTFVFTSWVKFELKGSSHNFYTNAHTHTRTHTHTHTHFSLSLSLSLSMATKGADIYSVFWQPVDGAGESTQMFEMWNSADSEVEERVQQFEGSFTNRASWLAGDNEGVLRRRQRTHGHVRVPGFVQSEEHTWMAWMDNYG